MKNTKLALAALATAIALVGCGQQKPPAKADKGAE